VEALVTLAATKRFTADEFMAMPDAPDFELIDGQLVERELMGAYSSFVAAKISFELNRFNLERPFGWVFDSDATYRCFKLPDTLRRADVSVILHGRLAGNRIPESYVSIAPDLVVEVISPTNKAGAVETKILEYLEAGVKLVWVVFPQSRTIHVRRAEGTLRVVREHEQLDGETLLPGFSCSVRDLFPQ